MKSYIIISKRGYNEKKTKEMINYIIQTMNKYGKCEDVLISNYKGASIDNARECTHNVDIVISIGGDGTFHEVVKGILSGGNENASLLHIPTGTANDLGINFNYHNNLNDYLNYCLIASLNDNPTDYDIFKINNNIFTYVAAGGYLTNAAYAPSFKSKKMFGKGAYVFSIISETFKKRDVHNITFSIDNKNYEGKYIAFVLTNSHTVGAFNVYDEVDLSDGRCELMMVKNDKIFNLIFDGTKIISGKKVLSDADCVETYNGSNFTFNLDSPFDNFGLDGEKSELQDNSFTAGFYKKVKVLMPSQKRK